MQVRTAIELGAILKAARRERGVSQVDLAAAIGVIRHTISRIEQGQYQGFSAATALCIADHLDLTLSISSDADTDC